MEFRILIKGGTVVDGSGRPAYAADVRVRDGVVAEIGQGLEAGIGERVVDATGCYVTPGFLETHNHWDGGVWWAPIMDPLPAYGITTSVNGNCGFSMAPHSEATRAGIVDIFNFFEDIPVPPMNTLVPWDWETWSEYAASWKRNVKTPVNCGAFLGHIPLRLYVMGEQAWERAATPDEVAQMCALLEDGLAAGAMGLSSNQLDFDRHERPLPSQRADDAEYAALLAVLARHPGATFQVIVDHFMRMTGPEQTERFGRLAKEAGVRTQWAGLPTLKFQAKVLPASQALHEGFKAEGLDVWTGYHHVAPTSVINFARSLVFSQNGNPTWQELVDAPTWADKSGLLTDPAWREQARKSWDNQFPHSTLFRHGEILLRESETGHGPTGVFLDQYMSENGFEHPSDALAQWVLDNGAESIVRKPSFEVDEDLVVALLKDPRSVGNVSDGGAHGKMFCGTGDNVLVLTDYVRDTGRLTVEEAVHALTWKIADFFGLHDRGLLEVGKNADIAVFALDEIERRLETKTWDVPDGEGGRTYRYTRPPAPMRLTLCNGVPTFEHGEFTGHFPGRFTSPQPA